jgi:hypothetical protein
VIVIATYKVDVCGLMTRNTLDPLLNKVMSAFQGFFLEYVAYLDWKSRFYKFEVDAFVAKEVDLSDRWYLTGVLAIGG